MVLEVGWRGRQLCCTGSAAPWRAAHSTPSSGMAALPCAACVPRLRLTTLLQSLPLLQVVRPVTADAFRALLAADAAAAGQPPVREPAETVPRAYFWKGGWRSGVETGAAMWLLDRCGASSKQQQQQQYQQRRQQHCSTVRQLSNGVTATLHRRPTRHRVQPTSCCHRRWQVPTACRTAARLALGQRTQSEAWACGLPGLRGGKVVPGCSASRLATGGPVGSFQGRHSTPSAAFRRPSDPAVLPSSPAQLLSSHRRVAAHAELHAVRVIRWVGVNSRAAVTKPQAEPVWF